MTGLELLNAFNIEGRTFQKGSDMKFQTTEIQYLLNKAQDIIFQKYYEKFDQGEDKRFALDGLITVAKLAWSTDASTNQDGVKTNGRMWKMPSNFYYSVEESAVDSDDNFIRIKPIGRDYYNININNPMKKPSTSLAWRLDHKPSADDTVAPDTNIYKRRETISADGVTLIEYIITYIKYPASIDVTDNTDEIELGYKATNEIIAEAINIAYATDKDQIGYTISRDQNNQNIEN